MDSIAGFCGFLEETSAEEREERAEGLGRALAGNGTAGVWRCPAGALVGTGGGSPLERPLGTARYAIVWTGEMENLPELRKFLRSRGYRLTAQGPAETALYAYMEHGAQVGEMLEGNYAFGLWDGLKRQLVACRGKEKSQPVYYVNQKGALAFSTHREALGGDEPACLEPGEWLALGPAGPERGRREN